MSCSYKEITEVSSNSEGYGGNKKHLVDSVIRAGDSREFYWYQGRKQMISPVLQNKLIIFLSTKRDEVERLYEATDSRASFGFPFLKELQRQGNISMPSKETFLGEIVKTPVGGFSRTSLGVIFEGDAFLGENGQEMYLTPIVYVKLASNSNFQDLEAYKTILGFDILGTVSSMSDWYILGCDKSSYSPLEIANILYQDNSFLSAYPYFLSHRETFAEPNDPLFIEQ